MSKTTEHLMDDLRRMCDSYKMTVTRARRIKINGKPAKDCSDSELSPLATNTTDKTDKVYAARITLAHRDINDTSQIPTHKCYTCQLEQFVAKRKLGKCAACGGKLFPIVSDATELHEAIKQTGISEPELRKAIHRGHVVGNRRGRHVVVSMSSLREYLNATA